MANLSVLLHLSRYTDCIATLCIQYHCSIYGC